MGKTIQKSIRSLFVFTLLAGVLYPLAVTAVAQLLAMRAANGSVMSRDGKVIGSELIGQKFSKAEYFWGRPSAVDYGTMPGGASQLGPTSQKLKDRVALAMKDLNIEASSDNKPYDLLLTSGSGLDPDIRPETATFQIERIAKARDIEKAELQKLIEEHLQAPILGFIGRPRVNVLKLNLALDALKR